MVFSSMVFLCVFLPIVLILYYLLPNLRVKNGFLIIVSLLFYAYGEPVYILLMLFSIIMNYLFGRMLNTRKRYLRKTIVIVAVVLNLGLLFVFKYLDMVLRTINQIGGSELPMTNLILPVGISFFTFQAMSYVIDVYRGDAKAEKNVFGVMLYISFFPQLIAGPIVKYHDIYEQIQERSIDVKEIAEGIRRFIIGLSKKTLISNTMAVTADALFAVESGELNVISAWIAALAYLFQIYFDFSGYSDMAIGMGHMFGFDFLENFNYPYISGSIKEFWRRWHISLSTWFKEYLYIPLGGNRKGKIRTCFNKMTVFFCTGLWHGANWTFVIWGLWHGLFIMLEEIIPIKKMPKVFRRIYTMLVVVIGFVIFRADSMAQGLNVIKEMFVGWNFEKIQMQIVFSQMTPLFILTFIIAIIGSGPIIPKIKAWSESREIYSKIIMPLSYVMSIGLLLLCMMNLAGGAYNPFIYFRF